MTECTISDEPKIEVLYLLYLINGILNKYLKNEWINITNTAKKIYRVLF